MTLPAPTADDSSAYDAAVLRALTLAGAACAAFDALDAHLSGMAEDWPAEAGRLRRDLADRLRGGR